MIEYFIKNIFLCKELGYQCIATLFSSRLYHDPLLLTINIFIILSFYEHFCSKVRPIHHR